MVGENEGMFVLFVEEVPEDAFFAEESGDEVIVSFAVLHTVLAFFRGSFKVPFVV